MSDSSQPNLREQLERARARLMDEAAQKLQEAKAIEAEMAKLAEYERLAAKFNLRLTQVDGESVKLDEANQTAAPPPIDEATPIPSAESKPIPGYNGTFYELVHSYRTDKRSSYQQLKHRVRSNYDGFLNRLMHEVGSERVADWSASRVQYLYDHSWTSGRRKLAMGHGMVAKLRLLCTYGATVLNDDGCIRLSGILGAMRFPIDKKRGERLTVDHVIAIREKAHEFGFHSIALAQAFQFEIVSLRQADVVGEWVPLREPGPPSEVTDGNLKWLRGLRWSEIDKNVLRKTLTSGRRDEHKDIEMDLNNCPMVLKELSQVPDHQKTGPIIKCESTMLPWTASEFRRKWRMIANAAGVPRDIKNMHSGNSGIKSPDLKKEGGFLE